MSMEHKQYFNQYLESVSDIPGTKLREVLDRFRRYLGVYAPEVDTDPNSVFVETFLRGYAQLVARHELATDRVLNDLNVARVAQDEIYNCDFVAAYLQSLGITPSSSTPSYGIIRLVFVGNQEHVIDGGSRLLFEGSLLFHFMTRGDSSIVIAPQGSPRQDGDWHELRYINPGQYAVDLVIQGPAVADLQAGANADLDTDIPDLLSASLVTDVQQGVYPTDLKELAVFSSRVFSSASFATRSGVTSFVFRQFPNYAGVSPVVSGDLEMVRDQRNLLGFSDGRVDVYVRGFNQLVSTTGNVRLAYNGDRYEGALATPEIPVHVDAVLVNTTTAASDTQIIGRSRDQDKAWSASGARSGLEDLSLSIANIGAPAATPYSVQIPSNDAQHPLYDADYPVTVTGFYHGDRFNSVFERTLEFEFNNLETIDSDEYAVAILRDLRTGQIATGARFNDQGVLDLSVSQDLVRVLTQGMTITVGGYDAQDLVDKSLKFLVEAQAQVITVGVRYRFDRSVRELDAVVESPEVRSPIDTLVKNPCVCFIESMIVSYRRTPGSVVDRQAARESILEHVNGLVYPNVFETSMITDFMLFAGAAGVQGIQTTGVFHPSVATRYSEDGLNLPQATDYTLVPRPATQTLLPQGFSGSVTEDLSNLGIRLGNRNIQYILDDNRLELREVRI